MTIEEAFTTLPKYSDNLYYQADVYVARKIITEAMTKYISGVNLGLVTTSWDDYITKSNFREDLGN